jgi:HAD superfamily hydrolase (TIGR01509 family)
MKYPIDVLPEAIVFDMDGTLVDSERLQLQCFMETTGKYGFDAREELYLQCIGATGAVARTILVDAYGAEFPLAEVLADWRVRYEELLASNALQLKAGARLMLEMATNHGIPCALATQTRRPLTEKKLRLTGVLDYFDTLVTGDEVRRGKPDPEHYLVAAERLGLAPAACWALEDSENGVRSALSAGCRVYQIPDLVPVSESVSHLGQTVLSSLVEVVAILERAINATTGSR